MIAPNTCATRNGQNFEKSPDETAMPSVNAGLI